jgi:hypothetical protein
MKRNLTRLILAAVVVMAVNGVVASSASAVVFTLGTTECTGGTEVRLCWSEKEEAASPLLELSGQQSETVAGGTVKFLILSEPEQEIECKEAIGSGTITQEGVLTGGPKTSLKGTITYKGCKLTKGPTTTCSIKEEEKTKELLGVLESQTELKLTPETGAVFIEIEYLLATCAFKGKHSVTGSQIVEILNPESHALSIKGKAITKAGTGLEFLSSPAVLTQELTLSFTGLEDFVDVSKTA